MARALATLSIGLLVLGLQWAAATAGEIHPDPNPIAPPETFSAEQRAHWAYQTPKRPPLPGVERAQWIRNPIDRFILAGLEEMGAAEADSTALIRRVTFDLTGLPPPRKRSRPSPATPSRAPSTGLAIGSSPVPGTGKGGPSTGSTWRTMPTRTSSSSMRSGPTPGAIAIGSGGTGARPQRDRVHHVDGRRGRQGGDRRGRHRRDGLNAIEDRAHVDDIHATILHLMGIDPKVLTHLHDGRDQRLTDVAGRVLRNLIS